jgi:acetolactate synthase-1/2/3 large subunit
VMRRAYTALRSGRPGPVLVTIPRGLGEYDDEEYPYTPVRGWRSAPDPDDVSAAAAALLAARRPLLYVGEGVLYGEATEALCRLAELAQAPVLTTLKAKSAFPENHPLSLGVRGEPAIDFLRRSDLVFGVGTSLALGHFRHTVPDARHKTIVQCTNDLEDVNRNYRVDVAVAGDAGLALEALVEEVSRRTSGGVAPNLALHEEIRAARAAMMAKYLPLMASEDTPINPYRVYGELAKLLDPQASFLTHDSGTTRDQLTTVYDTVIPRGFMGWGNVSTLGFGLAAAMAARLAHPAWQCVNVTGDAGVGYMLGNLEALVRYGVGVTTIHINNGGFAGYGPGFWGPGHDPYTCEVCDHAVADMSESVKAMGYYAEHVTDPADIAPALRRALDENAKDRPAYLEFICSQYPVFGAWCTG